MKKALALFTAVLFYATSLPVAAPVATVAMVGMTGCSMSMQQKEALLNTAIQSAEAVIAQAEPGGAWVQPMKNALAALVNSEPSWVNGGTAQNIITALNTIEAITSVIPFTAPYAALIDVLVAGIDAVLAVLPVSANQAKMSVALPSRGIYYDHHGRAKIGHPFYRTANAADYEKAWIKAGGQPLTAK